MQQNDLPTTRVMISPKAPNQSKRKNSLLQTQFDEGKFFSRSDGVRVRNAVSYKIYGLSEIHKHLVGFPSLLRKKASMVAENSVQTLGQQRILEQ